MVASMFFFIDAPYMLQSCLHEIEYMMDRLEAMGCVSVQGLVPG